MVSQAGKHQSAATLGRDLKETIIYRRIAIITATADYIVTSYGRVAAYSSPSKLDAPAFCPKA
jgi:hypothetical protein